MHSPQIPNSTIKIPYKLSTVHIINKIPSQVKINPKYSKKIIKKLKEQNEKLQDSIKTLKKEFENSIEKKPEVRFDHSPESKIHLVLSKYISNLNKKVDSYEAEYNQLKLRISLLSDDYVEHLHKKIARKEEKLRKLSEISDELNKPKLTPQSEPNYLNEMQGLSDLKNFYRQKIELASKILEKNAEQKKSLSLKFSDLSQSYRNLKLELFNVNKATPKYKKREYLDKSLKVAQRESYRSLSRLKVKHSSLKNQIFKMRKEEKSLGTLFEKIIKAMPRNKRYTKSIRSISQPRLLPSILNSSKSSLI